MALHYPADKRRERDRENACDQRVGGAVGGRFGKARDGGAADHLAAGPGEADESGGVRIGASIVQLGEQNMLDNSRLATAQIGRDVDWLRLRPA